MADDEWSQLLRELVSTKPVVDRDPRFVEPLPEHLQKTYPAIGKDLKGAIQSGREVLKPTPGQSAVGGVLQGAAFGHADEIMGAVEAPFSDRSYSQIRDEHRQNFNAQQATNPKAFAAGQVGGGLVGGAVMPMGPLGQIAGKGGAAARGAVTGAVSGEGYSEGQTLKEVGHDAAAGALAGASTGFLLQGLGEKISRAGQRQDQRLFRDVGKMGTQTQQANLERVGAQRVAQTAREFGIMSAPDKRVPVQAALNQTGQRIGSTYQAFDQAGVSRPLGSVMESMEKLRTDLSKTTEGEKLAAVVFEKQKAIWSKYGANKDAKMPLSALNAEVHDLEAMGFAGGSAGKLSEAAKAVVSRRTAQALDTELEAGLAEGAKQSPALKQAASELGDLNHTFRSLKVIDAIVKRKEAVKPFQQTGADKMVNKNPLSAPGRAALSVARGAGRAADAITVTAQKAAQAVGKEYPDFVHVIDAARANGATALSQPVVDALSTEDREKARAAFTQEIFGQ